MDTETDTHIGMRSEYEDKDQADMSTSKGIPQIPSKPQELRERMEHTLSYSL